MESSPPALASTLREFLNAAKVGLLDRASSVDTIGVVLETPTLVGVLIECSLLNQPLD